MSGHSKWSTIKRKKGVADARRGQMFTKMANAITIAAREGGSGDPSSNFKLRLAIEQAREVNMPKENIQRAVDRGLGKGTGGRLESVIYEGYGPGKIAFIIEAATDNKNRTSSEIKGLIERNGGTFVSPGSVSWMFKDTGLITVSKNGKSFNEIFEAAVDYGAEDVEETQDTVEVYTRMDELDKVKTLLIGRGLSVQNAELYKKPINITEVSDPQVAKKILSFMEKLEGHEDIQRVYSNFDIPDKLLESF